MGKGNRSRIERAMNESANVSKNVQAKKNKVSGAGIFVTVAAILVVVALLIGAIGVLNDGGWFARSKTVVEVEDYKVDGVMMNYFFMTQFNSYYEYYYQMWSYYFQSSYSSAYELMGIDATKSLKDQYMTAKEGEEKITWFDYFMDSTEDYVTKMLTCCVFADKEGIALTDEDYADIDHSIEEMKSNYEQQKALYESFGYPYYTTFSAFLAANYGTGVKEKDVRNCLELITLAAKYEEKLSDEKKESILADTTNAAVEEYVKNNPATFLMADYYIYSFSVNNKNKTDAEFEAEKAELLEKAKKLSESASKEDYKAAVIAMLLEAEKKAYRDQNWATYLKENENDEAKAEEKLQAYFEKTYTDEYMDLKFKATLVEGYNYPSAHTDLSKWIFGYESKCPDDCGHEKAEDHEESCEAAKEGDLTYIESTTEKEETVTKTESTTAGTTAEETTTEAAERSAESTTEGTTAEGTTAATTTNKTEKVKVTTYTVNVYLLEKAAYRNTEIAKNFGYVMFSAKADAETFLAEFQKGEMNKDTLLDVIEALHEQISPANYNSTESYLIGDLEEQKFTGADKWLKEAKAGDCSGVVELTYTTETTSNGTTTKKETTYYAVMVYDGDSYEYWYTQALIGATNEAITDWYEANSLKLTFSDKAYKYIDM